MSWCARDATECTEVARFLQTSRSQLVVEFDEYHRHGAGQKFCCPQPAERGNWWSQALVFCFPERSTCTFYGHRSRYLGTYSNSLLFLNRKYRSCWKLSFTVVVFYSLQISTPNALGLAHLRHDLRKQSMAFSHIRLHACKKLFNIPPDEMWVKLKTSNMSLSLTTDGSRDFLFCWSTDFRTSRLMVKFYFGIQSHQSISNRVHFRNSVAPIDW